MYFFKQKLTAEHILFLNTVGLVELITEHFEWLVPAFLLQAMSGVLNAARQTTARRNSIPRDLRYGIRI